MVFYNICFFLSLRNIISGKCSKNTRALRRSNKPSIITFFHNIHYVALLKLNFIIVLRGIVVKCPVPKTNNIISLKQRNRYLTRLMDIYQPTSFFWNTYGMGSVLDSIWMADEELCCCWELVMVVVIILEEENCCCCCCCCCWPCDIDELGRDYNWIEIGINRLIKEKHVFYSSSVSLNEMFPILLLTLIVEYGLWTV